MENPENQEHTVSQSEYKRLAPDIHEALLSAHFPDGLPVVVFESVGRRKYRAPTIEEIPKSIVGVPEVIHSTEKLSFIEFEVKLVPVEGIYVNGIPFSYPGDGNLTKKDTVINE